MMVDITGPWGLVEQVHQGLKPSCSMLELSRDQTEMRLEIPDRDVKKAEQLCLSVGCRLRVAESVHRDVTPNVGGRRLG